MQQVKKSLSTTTMPQFKPSAESTEVMATVLEESKVLYQSPLQKVLFLYFKEILFMKSKLSILVCTTVHVNKKYNKIIIIMIVTPQYVISKM